MHIPDGVLDPQLSIITYLTVLLIFLYINRYIKFSWHEMEIMPTISTLTAAIFVAQMINWPIPGGTSLHLVGAGLAGVLLGPIYGSVSITIILVVQCIFFGDGGITALGANILNMALIGVFSGYLVYKLIRAVLGGTRYSKFMGGFMAGWISIVLGGFACGVEIGVSSYFGFNMDVTVPIMVMWHALLGIVEGLLTGMIVQYVLTGNGYTPIGIAELDMGVISKSRIFTLLLLLISPMFSIYFASVFGYREPLDIALENLGYNFVNTNIGMAPFPDYTIPYLPMELGYIVSGGVGIGIIILIFRFIKKLFTRVSIL